MLGPSRQAFCRFQLREVLSFVPALPAQPLPLAKPGTVRFFCHHLNHSSKNSNTTAMAAAHDKDLLGIIQPLVQQHAAEFAAKPAASLNALGKAVEALSLQQQMGPGGDAPAPQLRLHGAFNLCPNTWRVQAYLDHFGLAYTPAEVDILAGANREPGFLRLNPQGFVPVLEDASGGSPLVVIESGALLQYVDTAWGAGRGTPGTPAELAKFYELWYRGVGSVRAFESRYVVHGGDYNPAAPKALLAEYQYLEAQLGQSLWAGQEEAPGRQFLASQAQPTLVDFLLLPNVHVSHLAGLDLPAQGLGRLEAWRQRMLELPGVARGDFESGWRAAVRDKQGLEWEQRRNAWFEYAEGKRPDQ